MSHLPHGVRMVEPAVCFPINLNLLKCYLRLPENASDALMEEAESFNGQPLQAPQEDLLLQHCLESATQLVEEMTERTLIQKTLLYESENDRIFLPMGPVIQVLQVSNRKDALIENRDYAILRQKGHTIIQLTQSRYLNPLVKVTYTAGFGAKPEEVPATLANTVLHTAALFYEYRDQANYQTIWEKVLFQTRDYHSFNLMPLGQESASNAASYPSSKTSWGYGL